MITYLKIRSVVSDLQVCKQAENATITGLIIVIGRRMAGTGDPLKNGGILP